MVLLNTHKRCAALLYGALLFALVSTSSAEDLLDVYRVAEQHDTELLVAKAQRNAAVQRYKQSISLLILQADINADITSNRRELGSDSSTTTTKGYTLSLTQPVYHHDTWKLISQTDALTAQAAATYQSVGQSLMVRTSELYFDVLAAFDDLELAIAEKEADAKQLDQAKQRFEVGLIAITDVHESQAARDLSAAREIASENDLSNSKEALRQLTGQYHDKLKRLVEEIPLLYPEPQNVDKWISTSMAQNYSLLAAQHSLKAAKENTRVQIAEHLPFVDIVGQHNYVDKSFFFQDESFTDSSVTLQVTLPLSRGGGTIARVRESKYQYNEARENLEQTKRATYRQASQAYRTVISKVNEVKALAQGVISTESALEASQAGLEVGTRTTVDVLNTRRTLFRAERDYRRTRYDYILATLKLKEAAGTLSINDFKKINEFLE